jgi:hypothetical protein
MIHKSHHRRDSVVSRAFSNEPMHLLADQAIGRMTLWSGTQFKNVHRLPGVHVHKEPDPVSQRYRIWGLLWERIYQCVMEIGGPLHSPIKLLGQSGMSHIFGHYVAVIG